MKLSIAIPGTLGALLLSVMASPVMASPVMAPTYGTPVTSANCYGAALDGGNGNSGAAGTIYVLSQDLNCGTPPAGNTNAALTLQNGATLDLQGHTLSCGTSSNPPPLSQLNDGVDLMINSGSLLNIISTKASGSSRVATTGGTIQYCGGFGVSQVLPSQGDGIQLSPTTISNVTSQYNNTAGFGMYQNVALRNDNALNNGGSGLIARDSGAWDENNVNITGGNYSNNGSNSVVNAAKGTSCSTNVSSGEKFFGGGGLNNFRDGIDIRGGFDDLVSGVIASNNLCSGLVLEGYISSTTFTGNTVSLNGLGGIQVSDQLNFSDAPTNTIPATTATDVIPNSNIYDNWTGVNIDYVFGDFLPNNNNFITNNNIYSNGQNLIEYSNGSNSPNCSQDTWSGNYNKYTSFPNNSSGVPTCTK